MSEKENKAYRAAKNKARKQIDKKRQRYKARKSLEAEVQAAKYPIV